VLSGPLAYLLGWYRKHLMSFTSNITFLISPRGFSEDLKLCPSTLLTRLYTQETLTRPPWHSVDLIKIIQQYLKRDFQISVSVSASYCVRAIDERLELTRPNWWKKIIDDFGNISPQHFCYKIKKRIWTILTQSWSNFYILFRVRFFAVND